MIVLSKPIIASLFRNGFGKYGNNFSGFNSGYNLFDSNNSRNNKFMSDGNEFKKFNDYALRNPDKYNMFRKVFNSENKEIVYSPLGNLLLDNLDKKDWVAKIFATMMYAMPFNHPFNKIT